MNASIDCVTPSRQLVAAVTPTAAPFIILPCTVFMNREMSYKDQNCLLHQALKVLNSAIKLSILV